MAENKEYITRQESMGTIQISEDVVASISSSVALETEGVGGLLNANEETAGDPAPAEDDYFATARLSRKQARDNAIHMLQEAENDENAEESVLNEASRTLQVLASYTVAESQIESLVTAKGYADCVVFMGEDSVSVVVAAPETGLNTADVARIKDIVVNETDYTPEQIKIMEAN